ncbi:putative membrane protein [Aggregatibacter actinomycetemcomitans D7S-1]|nr:putative membrane protein [Aggregatibacter actinomycetemcomitans D7S-1]
MGMETQQGSPMSMLFIFVIFGLIFYFMIYRPQAKRNKEHKKLMSELAKGTEVLTAGGIIGKITKMVENSDNIVIALNDSTEVTINRNYIVAVLPKGTIKTL